MRLRTVVAGSLLAAILAGCGGADDRSSAASSEPELVVFAASSLAPAFEQYGDRFDGADVRFSFAGSDDLAAQIHQGVVPDVYAAANTSLPDELHADGLVGKPTAFAALSLMNVAFAVYYFWVLGPEGRAELRAALRPAVM